MFLHTVNCAIKSHASYINITVTSVKKEQFMFDNNRTKSYKQHSYVLRGSCVKDVHYTG